MKKLLISLLIIFAVIIVLAGIGVLLVAKSPQVRKAVTEKVANTVIEKITTSQTEKNLFEKALGFDGARTYLLLFLNNTEIRPGGGFIGAYAVVKIDAGIPQILKVEGTEILDNLSPQDFPSVPPEPLQKFLYVKRWGFRDSNWSPDFASSSVTGLDLFKKEKGTAANDLSAVIGFTPTLLEELLKISGPVTVNGQEYNAENFTEKLEYEVEYGYVQEGLSFNERKQVISDLMNALVAKLGKDVFNNWQQYLDLMQNMLNQKQLVAYSLNPDEEKELLSKNWGGQMRNYIGDSVLWADANLASLKTDKAMERELSYSFAPTSSGQYVAEVRMKYIHKGKFDNFTTRYRTYARVFVPVGSKLISVDGNLMNDRTTEKGTVEQGVENNRQWFGAFTSIEPGKTGVLSFRFFVAPQIAKLMQNGGYRLLVQKQVGTLSNKLFLNLDFGRSFGYANPGEEKQNYGDNKYAINSDLLLDREFEVKF